MAHEDINQIKSIEKMNFNFGFLRHRQSKVMIRFILEFL